MALQEQVKLGDLLLQHGIITQSQLESALTEQKNTGKKLGSVLIKLGIATEDQIQSLLSQQFHLPYLQLQHYIRKPEIIKLLPEVIARRYHVIVLDDIGDSLLLGMVDPGDLVARDELTRKLKRKIMYCLVKESELMEWISKGYSERGSELSNENNGDKETSFEITPDEYDDDSSPNPVEGDEDDTPVMKFLDNIFKDAIQMGSSDIHIEPDKTLLRIRYRVDGSLVEKKLPDLSLAPAVVLRLKLMSKLNISEKRLPQDGRFNLKMKGKQLDVRLSTMPVQYGESAVMRLLESNS